MKLKKMLSVMFIVMAIVLNLNFNALAMNTGFSTQDLPENDRSTFISNINISLLHEEPVKKGIKCFDVNEKGMVAIGQEKDDVKEVCIYSSDGIFLYGYSFHCSQSFAVEWDGEFINIYFIRSDVIISLDSSGKILDIKEVQNTIDNNTHRNYLLISNSRTVGDTKYLLKNDMGLFNWLASSYSKLVVINAAGEENLIYDVSSTQFFKIVATVIIVIVCFVFAVGVIVRKFIDLRRGV